MIGVLVLTVFAGVGAFFLPPDIVPERVWLGALALAAGLLVLMFWMGGSF